MKKLDEKILADLSETEISEYYEKRQRENPISRRKRLGPDLADKQLVAMFAINIENSEVIKFFINQFSKLIQIPEYDLLDLRFLPSIIDEESGFYKFELLSWLREISKIVYATIEYFRINSVQAVVTVLYEGDVNPFIGVPFSTKLYSSLRNHLTYLAIYLHSILGSDIPDNEVLTTYILTKENITIERKKVTIRYINQLFEMYEKSKLDGNNIMRPPSVQDIQKDLAITLGIVGVTFFL